METRRKRVHITLQYIVSPTHVNHSGSMRNNHTTLWGWYRHHQGRNVRPSREGRQRNRDTQTNKQINKQTKQRNDILFFSCSEEEVPPKGSNVRTVHRRSTANAPPIGSNPPNTARFVVVCCTTSDTHRVSRRQTFFTLISSFDTQVLCVGRRKLDVASQRRRHKPRKFYGLSDAIQNVGEGRLMKTNHTRVPAGRVSKSEARVPRERTRRK